MAQYTPPLRDMQFVLHEVHGAIDALRALPPHAELSRELEGPQRYAEGGGKRAF